VLRNLRHAEREQECAKLRELARRSKESLVQLKRELLDLGAKNAELTREAERRDVQHAGELFDLRCRNAELAREAETTKRRLAEWEKQEARDYWAKLREQAAKIDEERKRRFAASILG